jgi:hypothetical protein
LQQYHGDQFKWWKKPEYPERTTDHGQATGKLYHLRLNSDEGSGSEAEMRKFHDVSH